MGHFPFMNHFHRSIPNWDGSPAEAQASLAAELQVWEKLAGEQICRGNMGIFWNSMGIDRFYTRPGKHTKNYMENHHVEWEKSLFRLGHFQ